MPILVFSVQAHDPVTTNLTWAKEISRIVYKRCASCHSQPGEAMPLTTYRQARPWAKALRDEVANRRMPPWGPVAGINSFKGDPSLSQTEIQMLLAWVEGGAPEGDPAFLPQRPPTPEPVPRPPYARAVRVSGGVTFTAATTLVGIKAFGALDAWAEEPDGAITRLIRIENPSPLRTQPFLFENPLTFPAGARLTVTSPATLYFTGNSLRR